MHFVEPNGLSLAPMGPSFQIPIFSSHGAFGSHPSIPERLQAAGCGSRGTCVAEIDTAGCNWFSVGPTRRSLATVMVGGL
jgi:hypothetical protein